jgi:receptor protein-tyrosine kinase
MDMKRDFELSRVSPIDEARFTVEPQHALSLGDILRRQCQLGDAEVVRITVLQAERGLRFGEAAVALKLVKPADVAQALARQFGYACTSVEAAPHLAELAAAVDPHGDKAEVFRDLRAQVMLRPGGAEPSALAIVSPESGDGRTHIAANLAVVFSQMGQRTVLVDANLRAPRLHTLFDLPPRPGLTAILADRQLAGGLDRVALLPNLHVLQVGAPPPNPQELVQRDTFRVLLRELTRKFDRVIVDTPAAQGTADARVIAAACAQALVIGRRDHSTARHLRELVEGLRARQVDLVGVVMNAR